MRDKEKIRRLRAENRSLRRENEYLRHRLSMELRADAETESSASEKVFAKRVKERAALHAKSYFGYLLERFRRSRTFLIYDKTRFAVRGFFFVKKIWTLLVWLFAFLGIGAQFLLVAGAAAVFVPAALISSAAIGLYGYFARRKWDKLLLPLLSENTRGKLYILFLSGAETLRGEDYFDRWISELSQRGAVILVSFSIRDIGSAGALRENIYKIHVSYYFSLVKRLDHGRIVKIF